jgi:predicted ATPase/class 3 adenylate cyclase
MIPGVRNDLPSGTVTFVFTDVEGSTKLLHALGAEAYADALAEHRRIVREACAAEHGVEVDTQGDAFFFAFPSAPGAVTAAQAITDALAESQIHLRIGVHTGTPVVTDEGYVGDDVHLAARVASSGHGGQVVLSQATRALVDGLLLTDLGEHRLKDIEGAVPIYQLGDRTFPPLKTISNTNLPRPASSFVGREREQEEVVHELRGGTRLLTLTGPGGSGKTRLALEAATELIPAYKAGVFWVGLASLREPSLVTDTIAQTLGARDGLAGHIGDREMLLLLDNLEQVIEAAPELSGLVQSCPNLALLVTSRELLRVHGEVEYAVPPLASSEAVSLFCQRSRLDATDGITELCSRLDDLPLAVELAAARTKVLSPTQILERLSQRLDLLRGGRDAEARQQTLRATIAWSYDLLSDEEQSLFRALSVFAGGCTLDAAEEVAGGDLDTLQALVEKSLLRYSEERFWMLETIREYAAELRHHEADEALRRRHAEYFLRLAEEAEPHLTGAEQARWLQRLDAEHENLRLSQDSLRHAGRGSEELRLVGALMRFWYQRGHLREGSRRCEDALAAHDDQSLPRVKALFGACLLAHRLGEYERADAIAQERLELARLLDDAEGVASALVGVGMMASTLGDDMRAELAYAESAELARAAGYPWIVATATFNLGSLAEEKDDDVARVRFEESLALYREVGDGRFVAATLCNLGLVAFRQGRNDDAEALLRESLEDSWELIDKELVIWCLEGLAALAVSEGDAGRAAFVTGAIIRLRQETGHAPQPSEQRLNEQTRSALDASGIGQERLDAALVRGREMTLGEVVDYVLHA